MIHSMSGGIISEYDNFTFVLVRFNDTSAWYIADFDVAEGDKVKAPFGVIDAPRIGEAVKVERNVNCQVAPIPVKRAKRLISVVK